MYERRPRDGIVKMQTLCQCQVFIKLTPGRTPNASLLTGGCWSPWEHNSRVGYWKCESYHRKCLFKGEDLAQALRLGGRSLLLEHVTKLSHIVFGPLAEDNRG